MYVIYSIAQEQHKKNTESNCYLLFFSFFKNSFIYKSNENLFAVKINHVCSKAIFMLFRNINLNPQKKTRVAKRKRKWDLCI